MKKLLAEFLGTALLVAVVVGSGIMATDLTQDVGLQLLINTIATVFGLAVLILILAPISGAHINPVVTLVDLIQGKSSVIQFIQYVVTQVLGAISGALLANTMFDQAIIETSTKIRSGTHLYLAEIVATTGLILVINLLLHQKNFSAIPAAVAAWIGSAYFFTSSTSFANPAVTIGRTFSDSFAGIAPSSAPQFIAAQLLGALIGLALVKVLTHDK
ncbi:MAG: antitoxin [Actinobacteria bacterium BACL15 MAG-120619-bin91]|jgi:glycerol uptake facilitator-like aquaporin|uniref:Antitoxin n=2 Tax=ac1 cluster TaxID=1655545 RepID=A0A0R2PIM7_9ACTN|nr:MAG: antitoxin [Actinobacteria bacterium BACL15 MAG-120619-bin91]KRO37871.1 MAG: antitoxin [Actinobacteria bacterium BACL15 MAG-120823-bin78]